MLICTIRYVLSSLGLRLKIKEFRAYSMLLWIICQVLQKDCQSLAKLMILLLENLSKSKDFQPIYSKLFTISNMDLWLIHESTLVSSRKILTYSTHQEDSPKNVIHRLFSNDDF